MEWEIKQKNDKFFSNYKVDNATRLKVVVNQWKRDCLVDGKIQSQKSYTEILKTEENTAGKLKKTGTKEQLAWW